MFMLFLSSCLSSSAMGGNPSLDPESPSVPELKLCTRFPASVHHGPAPTVPEKALPELKLCTCFPASRGINAVNFLIMAFNSLLP